MDAMNTFLRNTSLLASALIISVLAGCAGSNNDETAGWSQNKLFVEAKDAMEGGDFPKCVKYFERLEARFPFGPYAQQAQINVAYCHWKDGELAQAIVAVDRFIQLHPGHASIDYAYYLKGLITFNDNMGFLGKLTGQDLSERDPKAAREAFEQAVAFIAGNASSNPNVAFAGSVPYLMLSGNLMAGWQLGRSLLAALDELAPGDFAAVQRQAQILAETLDADAFMAQLEAEHRLKPEVRERRGVGFLN